MNKHSQTPDHFLYICWGHFLLETPVSSFHLSAGVYVAEPLWHALTHDREMQTERDRERSEREGESKRERGRERESTQRVLPRGKLRTWPGPVCWANKTEKLKTSVAILSPRLERVLLVKACTLTEGDFMYREHWLIGVCVCVLLVVPACTVGYMDN